jgi:long-chain fatty acid transport protein
MRRTALTVLCTSLLLTTSAFASGFGLREVSASAFGNSYAGAPAVGGEASTMFFNPALVADVETLDMSDSVLGLLPDAKGDFTATTAAGALPVTGPTHIEDIVNTALLPSLAVRARLSDQFTVGLQVTSPWGMVTDYGPDWVGRYYATNSDVKTVNVTAVVGFQPTPELAFAAGVQVQYIKGRLGKAIDFGSIGAAPPFSLSIPGGQTYPGARDGTVLLKAQDWGIGYVLGITWTPNESLSLGLSYRSQIDNTLKGTETFYLGPPVAALGGQSVGQIISGATHWFHDGGAKAEFSTPATVTFGARYKINDRFTALVSVDWTDWTAFSELRAVTSPNTYSQPDDVTTMDWKSTWFGSVGVEYKPRDNWVIRLGAAYDETPTGDQFRTPGIPDGSRYWITVGAGVQLTDHINLDVSYGHLFFQKGEVNLLSSVPENHSRGSLNGVVNMGVNILGAEISYHL